MNTNRNTNTDQNGKTESKSVRRDAVNFPLDHFGIVSAQIFAQLLTQAGDKRKRRTAFNQIARMCKDYKVIPRNSEVHYIGVVTDASGQISYQLQFLKIEPQENFHDADLNT